MNDFHTSKLKKKQSKCELPIEVTTPIEHFVEAHKKFYINDPREDLFFKFAFIQIVIWLHESIANHIKKDVMRGRDKYSLLNIEPLIVTTFETHFTKKAFKNSILLMYKDSDTSLDDFDEKFLKRTKENLAEIFKSPLDFFENNINFKTNLDYEYIEYDRFIELRNIYAHSLEFNTFLTTSVELRTKKDNEPHIKKCRELLNKQNRDYTDLIYSVLYNAYAIIYTIEKVSEEFWHNNLNTFKE